MRTLNVYPSSHPLCGRPAAGQPRERPGRRGIGLAAVLFLIAACGGCSPGAPTGTVDDPPPPPPPPVRVFTAVTLSPANAAIFAISSPTSVSFTAAPVDQFGSQFATAGTPAFEIDNESIAVVDGTGLVTAIATGTTTIRATITVDGITKSGSATVVVASEAVAAAAGVWRGTVAGTPGTANIEWILRPDLTMSGTGDRLLYVCALAGTWEVTGQTVGIQSQEVACTRTFVNITGTVEGNTFSGSWTASSGASGTFALTK
jgi:hypothetical protein